MLTQAPIPWITHLTGDRVSLSRIPPCRQRIFRPVRRALQVDEVDRRARAIERGRLIIAAGRARLDVFRHAYDLQIGAREAELDGRIGSASAELRQIPPRAIEEARLERRVEGELEALPSGGLLSGGSLAIVGDARRGRDHVGVWFGCARNHHARYRGRSSY